MGLLAMVDIGIVEDISERRYSNIEIVSILSACTGNRTTPLVVSISLTPNHELVKYSAPAQNPSKLN
jgi:hypothetical protein